MSLHVIHHAIEQLEQQQPLRRRLVAAYHGLELIEFAARTLVFLNPDDPLPLYRQAQQLAADARCHLARAPSMAWPIALPPPVLALADHAPKDVTAALADLVDAVVLALAQIAATADDSQDLSASRAAAIRINALRPALP